MKNCLFILISCTCISSVYAQNNQWTWMGGENNYRGVNYGLKGVADSGNRPGIRSGAASWKDTSGSFWLFGGAGTAENNSGALNDLWKYDPATKRWTWVSGDSAANQAAVYGTRGVASPGNKPGAWSNAVSWTDASENFWLYSNVLWKYNPYSNQWTWVNGDTAITGAVYGMKGIAGAANKPRSGNAVEWTDGSGNFWLYGNVLWKYDPVADLWTWVNGDTVSTKAVYGLRGIPDGSNTPGTRSAVTAWSDASGKFWLFGGSGTVSTPYTYRPGQNFYSGDLNDLWRYDIQTNAWTWMGGDTLLFAAGNYGTPGTEAPANRPGARSDAVSWTDLSGNFWMFGGYQYTSFSLPNYHPLNDLWKYNPATNLWTCYNRLSPELSRDTFEVIGMESPKTKPATRFSAVGWTEASGNLWLFGGITYDNQQITSPLGLNSLLRYNPGTNMWSLESKNNYGPQHGIYGTQGIAGTGNLPGGRYHAAGSTDSAGNVWLFGGQGYSSAGIYFDVLNDMWKLDTANKWTWASGNHLPRSYMGTSPVATNPTYRENALTWVDAGNRLWLFGGNDIAAVPYNDLWSFDKVAGLWTQKSGNTAAVYGIKGQAAAANKPGRRSNAASWTDKTGKLWMFGGVGGFQIGMGYAELNDVWSFDPSTNLWTWISGDSTSGQTGSYGSIGIPDAGNKPGARQGAVSWPDGSGNVWFFGGYISNNGTKCLNDLWKYNTVSNTWTWVSGDSAVNQKGVYGTKGIPDAGNKPGARYDAVSWMDATGKLWLFGGVPVGGSGLLVNPAYFLNDMWTYDPATNLWTWVSGDSTINSSGSYGSLGTANSTNKPGARSGAVAWKDQSGNFWLMGGIGYGWKGSGLLTDIWKFTPASAALPVSFLNFSAARRNTRVVLDWSTAAEQHSAYYAIQRSSNGIAYDSIGRMTAKNSHSQAINHYLFTDYAPFQQINYYRLKQVDLDGRYTYSTVLKLVVEHAGYTYTLLQNPVLGEIKISLQSDKQMPMQIAVRDAAGHLLVSRNLQVLPGSSIHALSVKELSSGTYFLALASGGISETKKIIKQ